MQRGAGTRGRLVRLPLRRLLSTAEPAPAVSPPPALPQQPMHESQTVPETKRTWAELERALGQTFHLRVTPAEMQEVGKEARVQASRLFHGLEKVLFTPGVHQVVDNATSQFLVDPYLRDIVHPEQIDMTNVGHFVPPSRDKRLAQMARENGRMFAGSTSSLSGLLCHFYFLIANHPNVHANRLSKPFELMPRRFTRASRFPAEVRLVFNDHTHFIDSMGEDDPHNILSKLGHTMEKMLTSSQEQFSQLIKQNMIEPTSNAAPIKQHEAYRFVKVGDFLMRSQLDCEDERLPKKVIDLKTRATVPIRLDVANYKEYVPYKIIKKEGILNSFEREYYDMIRSAFLKYSFQLRIGNMDGIMVAYHNTKEVFGFQYITHREIDENIYGNIETGEAVFGAVTHLLNHMLKIIAEKHPNQSLRLCVNTSKQPVYMDVIVLPYEKDANPSGLDDASLREYTMPLSHFRITTTSMLNGELVHHPVVQSLNDNWQLSYTITDITGFRKHEHVTQVLRALRDKRSKDSQPGVLNRLSLDITKRTNVRSGTAFTHHSKHIQATSSTASSPRPATPSKAWAPTAYERRGPRRPPAPSTPSAPSPRLK